jgi:NADH:ubiquinone oxidoreductase subunit 6 (subunit J)
VKPLDLPLAVTLPNVWESWPLLLPLVLGGVGVFLMLPRPQRGSPLRGAALGLLALVLAAQLIVRFNADSIEGGLFFLFAAVAVISACMLITLNNPARAALSFTLVILSSCGLFLLLAAPFLMAATIIIYAGAIIVTFLFVLMLAQQVGSSDANDRSREPGLAALTGFVLLGAILYVLRPAFDPNETQPEKERQEKKSAQEAPRRSYAIDALLERTRKARSKQTASEIAAVVGDNDELFTEYQRTLDDRNMEDLQKRVKNEIASDWPGQPADGKDDPERLAKMQRKLEKLEQIGLQARARLGLLQPSEGRGSPMLMSSYSGPPSTTPPGELRRDAAGRPVLPAENAALLGKSLFTDYLVPVELGGLLLLVAAVGAIAIAHRHRTTTGRPS